MSSENFNPTVENSILVLVDYQPGMVKGIRSGNTQELIDATSLVVQSASIMQVPTVMTSIQESRNGTVLPELLKDFKGKVVEREVASFNICDDPKLMRQIMRIATTKGNERNTIVLGGWWTGMCVAFSAIGLMQLGFNVMTLNDCIGDASVIAHQTGIERMKQSGVVPMTWMPVVSAWMNDWNSEHARELGQKIFGPNMNVP
jgi:nicotinamidase-related amidase